MEGGVGARKSVGILPGAHQLQLVHVTVEDLDRLAVVTAGHDRANRRCCLERNTRFDEMIDALLRDASQTGCPCRAR